jgi:hypothetical protein
MKLASFFGENKSACRGGMCAGDPECPDKYCEGLGGGTYWPLIAEPNEAQEAADKPITPSVGEMALVALIVVPVAGVVGWFLFSNAPILWALVTL